MLYGGLPPDDARGPGEGAVMTGGRGEGAEEPLGLESEGQVR